MTNTFWAEIDAQLDRIAGECPAMFDGVRAILTSGEYPAIAADINRNGARTFGPDAAFFAGSGGDRTLQAALRSAGWRIIWADAAYYWTARHPGTGETLTYTEGDVTRGAVQA